MTIPYISPDDAGKSLKEIVIGLSTNELFDEITMIYESDPSERKCASEEFLLIMSDRVTINQYPYIAVELLSMQAQAGLQNIGAQSHSLLVPSETEMSRRLLASCLLLKCLSQNDIFIFEDNGFLLGISNYFMLGLLDSSECCEIDRLRKVMMFIASVYHSRINCLECAPFAALAYLLLRNRIDTSNRVDVDYRNRLNELGEYWNQVKKETQVSGGLLHSVIHSRYAEQWWRLFGLWSLACPETAHGEYIEQAKGILL